MIRYEFLYVVFHDHTSPTVDMTYKVVLHTDPTTVTLSDHVDDVEHTDAFVSPTRLTIKLDRLIVLSKSSLLGWFLHVSLIVIIKGRSPMEVSLIVIIKQVST